MTYDDWQQAWQQAYQIESGGDDVGAAELFCTEVCPVCETDNGLSMDVGGFKLTCCICGTIVDNYTDEKPEWTVRQEVGIYSTDPTRGEVINPLLPHASMSTEIVPTGRVQYRQYKMIKLNRWGAMSPMERSIYVVFTKIDRACSRSHVPDPVQYTTKALFRRVYELNMRKHQAGRKREGLRGVKRDGLIAACLYMAFKVHDLYWKKDTIATVFAISSAEVRRGISIFWDLIKDEPLTDKLVKITGCKQYIHWYSVELGLPRAFSTFASKLYTALKRQSIGSSKQPQSVAAGCLWTVCQALQPELPLDQLAQTTGISKATIRDVEQMTAGTERVTLTGIFAADMCSVCHIENPLTCNKIQQTAKRLCSTGMPERHTLWGIAAFAVYFVLTINDIAFDEYRLCARLQIDDVSLLQMAREIVLYRDAIISDCVGGRQTRSVPDDDDDDVAVF